MRRPLAALYGWNIKEISRVCGVSLKTAQRWKAGQTVPPKAALWLISGELGYLDPAWTGWTLRGGQLTSPEGWRATPGDVLSIQLTQAQLAAYRHETLQLRATLAEMEFEEQPLPGQWTIALEG